MGICSRLRRMTLVGICASGGVLGAGGIASGTADAAVNCFSPLYGSGSTLQTIQQQKSWAPAFKTASESETNNLCKLVGGVVVKYNEPKGTGSGKGLEEFGMPGKVLKPANAGNEKSLLDGFIGTDDPPTATQLVEGEEAAGEKDDPETIPVVAAPVAELMHLPTGCEPAGTAFEVKNTVLNELWLGKFKKWSEFLAKIKGLTGIGAACEVAISKEVRSDGSGTSFADKNYLCQVEEAAEKCSTWEAFVSDASSWPAGTEEKKTHENSKKEVVKNEGSGGEVKAVIETPGSVGYVNFANALEEGLKAWATKDTATFWVKVQDNGTGETGEFAEPGKEENAKGNCPSEAGTEGLPAETENSPNWSKFHLAKPKTATRGTYSICTLTYDVAWESYHGNKTLTKEYEKQTGAGKVEELGNSTKQYMSWLLNTSGGDASANIAKGYSLLPKNVRKIAEKTVTFIKP